MKYDVLSLYIVNVDGIKYICEKISDTDEYIEIFTNKNFKDICSDNLESLSEYYKLLVMKSYITGERLLLTKEELLLKFVKINSYYFYRQSKNNCVDDILKHQKEYLELLNELKKKNPEKAKEIALKSLQRSGILDKDGELKAPYNEVFVETDEVVKTLKKIISKIIFRA